MTHYYLDSSAIVKRYFLELGSAWVQTLTRPQAGNTLILSEVALAETAAVIAAKHRAPGGISLDERKTILSLFLLHCKDEYQLTPVSRLIIDQAVILTQNHRLRGYDAVQLATALAVNGTLTENGLPGVTFVAADADLLAAAQAEGLLSDNPNTHF